MDINSLIASLASIKQNFLKSPNRRYLRRTLKEKLATTKTIYNQLLTELDKINNDREQKILLTSIRNIYLEITNIINNKLATHKNIIKFKTIVHIILLLRKSTKMAASALEMIKLVSSVVALYDGESQKLDQTLDALRTIKPLIADANREATLQAVVSRFSGKARQKVSTVTANTSIDTIIAALGDCRIKTNPESILALLNATTQTSDIKPYIAEIEKHTLALEQAYVNDEMAVATASKYANKAGIKALANGLKNPQAKTIIKAGRFEKLSEAIEAAVEESLEQTNSTTAQATVLAYNQNVRSNQPNDYPRNYNRPNNYGRRGNQRNFQPRNNFNRENFPNNRNFHNNRNVQTNFGNRNYQNNNGNRPNNYQNNQNRQNYQPGYQHNTNQGYQNRRGRNSSNVYLMGEQTPQDNMGPSQEHANHSTSSQLGFHPEQSTQ